MADVIRLLNAGPEMIVGISRESGIGMYKLNKWKDGNGEPSGDDMLKLVEAIGVITGTTGQDIKDHLHREKSPEETIRDLKMENDGLRQTIHDLQQEKNLAGNPGTAPL